MRAIQGKNVTLLDSELRRREEDNRAYMMRLTRENLMRNYLLEAGLWANASLDPDMHGGWESPTCQLRGHFTGHWLSAAAMIIDATGDPEIRGKAEAIVADLARCQEENGDGWAGSIPEKYLDWIARGKSVWAPQYTLHKTLMGLVDMARLGGSDLALQVADRWGDWFDRWTSGFSREEMDNILDVETGGMLEIWAEMLALTGGEKYRRLLERYTRARLFDELLAGRDPLTNMHANTTIPEIMGCARAYEVTGEERWLDIVKAYWRSAVTLRGSYVTGGQTCGEIWTPMGGVSARLGRKNQEHCTVYNMMRLADFLFRHTGDVQFADYIEKNLFNGIMAQGYYRHRGTNGFRSPYPESGLISYFLPLRGGDHKGWGSETKDFWCCHGTLVQANACHNRYIYYQDGADVYLCQYFDSDARLEIDGKEVVIRQRRDWQNGYFQLTSDSAGSRRIGEVTSRVKNNPEELRVYITAEGPGAALLRLHVRRPSWAGLGESAFVAPEAVDGRENAWLVTWPMSIHCEPLTGDPTRTAFLYGPAVLAGLVGEERTLHADPAHPEMSGSGDSGPGSLSQRPRNRRSPLCRCLISGMKTTASISESDKTTGKEPGKGRGPEGPGFCRGQLNVNRD